MSTENNSKKKSSKIRCFLCGKKVGVFGLTCKCGNIYCSIHFQAENHECKYDFKKI